MRYIELMRMGHWQNDRLYHKELLPMSRILALIGQRFDYLRTQAPFD
jgi:hypothetical protein